MTSVHGQATRAVGAVAAALAALAAIAVASWSNLNGDVRYVLGGLETAGKGGVSIWDVFVSRPLAYKLFMAALDKPVAGPASDATHLVLRLEAYALVAVVTVVLFLGVRRVAGRPAAAGIAGATGLGLFLASPWHLLEPDWVAVLAAVLAVGAACAPRRAWVGALLAGPFVMLVVAVKLSTFPIALVALIVIGVFDRRRAAWTTLSTLVWVGIWYVLITRFQPWEWTWMADLANLVHVAPQRIYWDEVVKLQVAVGDAAVLSPVLALLPATAAALVSRGTGRGRWLGGLVAVVAFGLTLAPAYGQGEFFMYHFAATVVLAAGTWGAAFALCPGFRLPLVVITIVVSTVSLVLVRQPPAWRLEHSSPIIWAYEITALALAVVAWFLAGRTSVSLPWSAGVVVLTFALLPPVLPGSPYAFSTYNYAALSSRSPDAALVELGQRLGPDTPVLYLTYGTVNHAMGNPTTCRYPSPLWLQRGPIPRIRERPSYADNLRCLTEDRDARYLVVQTNWFSRPKSAPDVQELISERFDCSAQAQIPAPPPVIVCPARP